jgi:hypothetical protein
LADGGGFWGVKVGKEGTDSRKDGKNGAGLALAERYDLSAIAVPDFEDGAVFVVGAFGGE